MLNFLFKFKLTVPLLCLCAFCLDRPSPKWPIRVGRKTLLTHSLSHADGMWPSSDAA